MRRFLARRFLAAFSRRYGYDTSYAEHMLEVAPSAFFKFARLSRVAQHREVVPARETRAAAIIGALAEDCGPCTELSVTRAREAGLTWQDIEAVLTDRRDALSAETECAVRFARALVARSADLPDARAAVRTRWGDAGVVDLTLACQFGRMFPLVKAGLGYIESCQSVCVDGRSIRPAMKTAA